MQSPNKDNLPQRVAQTIPECLRAASIHMPNMLNNATVMYSPVALAVMRELYPRNKQYWVQLQAQQKMLVNRVRQLRLQIPDT